MTDSRQVAQRIIQRLHSEAWRTAPDGLGINGWFDVNESARICAEEGHYEFSGAAQPAPDPETWSGRVDLRDRLVAALDRGHEDGTLLVTAYRYPDGATDKGVTLTHFGLVEDLLDRSFLQARGSGGET